MRRAMQPLRNTLILQLPLKPGIHQRYSDGGLPHAERIMFRIREFHGRRNLKSAPTPVHKNCSVRLLLNINMAALLALIC